MPMYEFRCSGCGQVFERLVRADTQLICPQCAGTDLHKCVTAPQAPGTSAGVIASARRQAAREGHFSHYGKAERSKASRGK